ncbi:MAG: hypothetical protein ABR532_03130 [Candidatus Dormibacteria bacterium]
MPEADGPDDWPVQPAEEPPSSGILGRLKERWAVQRALARTPAEADDGIQVAPAPTPRMWARRHRGSSSLPRRAARPDGGLEPSPPRDGAEGSGSAWPGAVPDQAQPVASEPKSRPWPGRHTAPLLARRGRLPGGSPGSRDGAQGRSAEVLRSALRNPALAIVTGALMVVIVIALTVGRSASPIKSRTPPASAQPDAPSAQRVPATANPAPDQVGPAPASAPPGTTAVQLSDVRALGSGATGAQLKGIRYGDHPGSFFRAVLDFGGASGDGAPRATIGFKDPTTMWVVFDGLAPGASPTQPAPGGPIISAAQVSPSPAGKTIYEFKLARPVSLTNQYLSAPLRLVLDLR